MKDYILVFVVCISLFLNACSSTHDEIDLSTKIGLEKYPYAFLDGDIFNAVIVVGNHGPEEDYILAQDFLEHLDNLYELPPATLRHYKQLEGLYSQNTLFIATCNTIPHSPFVNLFLDCLSMEKNTGMLRIVENNGVTIIALAGYDFQDTKEVLHVLTHYDQYDLSGREIQVRGELPDLTIRITG